MRAAVDLSQCENEPIHAPGAVQAHAAFLAIDIRTGRPCAASRSLAELTGLPFEALVAPEGLGVFDAETRETLAAVLRGRRPVHPLRLGLANGAVLSGLTYAADEILMFDIEPDGDNESLDQALMLADGAMQAMRDASDEAELHRLMVEATAGVTGFDRAMLYRFDPEWNGDVVAETRCDAAPGSFLGLKFPNSDIPAQARRLFLRNRVRQIVDVDAPTSPIEPARHPRTRAPLDLSDSQVRAVSPVHLEYLRNMGVRASLVIALVVRGRLWGLLACHHYAGPRALPARLRSVCALLCEAFSAQLSHRLDQYHAARLESFASALDKLAARAAVVAKASAGTGFRSFVESVGPSLLEGVGADGAWVWVGDAEFRLGVAPMQERVAELVIVAESLSSSDRGGVVSIDGLGAHGTTPTAEAAGLAYVTLSGGQGAVLAVRKELRTSETWAGDPDKRVTAPDEIGRLHPRRSFELWRSERRGCCAPWTPGDRGALRILAEHISQWRLAFEQARREALIRRLDASRDESRRLALVAERANDTVILTDAAGRITWVNAAFSNLSGYTAQEAIGRKPGSFLQGPATDPAEVARIGAALRAHEPVRSTIVNYSKDGRPYWVEVEITPVFDAAGQPDQFIAIERDVTKVREREAALEAALARAQESDRLKDEFLRILSHEVRTPLNGLLGGAALLTHGVAADKRRDIARQVEKSGQALLSMFSAMLDVARAEAEKPALALGDCRARVLMREAAASVSAQAAEKRLSVEIAPDADLPLRTDCRRVRDVLVHFLSNAIKFTDEGRVRLGVRRRPDRVRGLRFEVEDSGPGVPEAARARIFEPFAQADGAETRRFGGLGLGLAVCRKLAHELGGEVGCEDPASGGALFWLDVPDAVESAPAKAGAAGESA